MIYLRTLSRVVTCGPTMIYIELTVISSCWCRSTMQEKTTNRFALIDTYDQLSLCCSGDLSCVCTVLLLLPTHAQ